MSFDSRFVLLLLLLTLLFLFYPDRFLVDISWLLLTWIFRALLRISGVTCISISSVPCQSWALETLSFISDYMKSIEHGLVFPTLFCSWNCRWQAEGTSEIPFLELHESLCFTFWLVFFKFLLWIFCQFFFFNYSSPCYFIFTGAKMNLKGQGYSLVVDSMLNKDKALRIYLVVINANIFNSIRAYQLRIALR